MIAFEQEARLLAPVARYVRRKAYRYQLPELPFYDYRIDLYGFSARADRTIAVELKLGRWRRALEQAILYQLCADFTLIALPRPMVARVEVGLLAEYGVGLLAVGPTGRCEQIIAPRLSTVTRPHYREYFIQLLQGQAGA